MAESNYFHWDEDQQRAYCQQGLSSLIPVLGGQLHWNEDDEQFELRTQVGPRPTRVVVDLSFGGVEIHTQFANTVGVLVLHWDPEKQPKAPGGGPWDDDGEVRHFIGPGVYIEEYPEEANAMIQLVGGLPPQLVNEFVQAMPNNFARISIDSSMIELDFKNEVDILPNPTQFFPMVFGLIDRIAQTFESGQNAVAAKPRVYIRGQAVNPGGPITCPFCHTVVNVAQASHCPNCGGAIQQPPG